MQSPKPSRLKTKIVDWLRVKESLIVGIFLALPVAAITFIFSFLDTHARGLFAALPIARYFRFPGASLLGAVILIYLTGFITTSRFFNRYLAPVVERIPLLRGLWRGANKIVKNIVGFRARVVVKVEEFYTGCDRWRTGWVTGIVSYPKPFPHPYMLAITLIHAQGLGTDFKEFPPSGRIYVIDGKPTVRAMLTFVLSGGTIIPEIPAGSIVSWPEWARLHPEKIRQLIELQARQDSETTEEQEDAS